ncbi:MAG: heme-copper oxidase subunit III [Anaerolineae bacterium]|nr:heme-copper oxidase subunit III [Anaerolineae bacterium]
MTEALSDSQHRQTTSQANNTKLGFWFFIGGEITLFSALILMFIVFRVIHAADFADFRAELNMPLVGLNTLVLVTSSYLVVRSLRAVQRQRIRSGLYQLLIVLLLGTLFVGGQAYEWAGLFGNGVDVSSTFGSPFFIITGIHGTHGLIGLAWASFLLIEYGTGSMTDEHPIEIFGLYWHFVDIVWIILFSLIYLL